MLAPFFVIAKPWSRAGRRAASVVGLRSTTVVASLGVVVLCLGVYYLSWWR